MERHLSFYYQTWWVKIDKFDLSSEHHKITNQWLNSCPHILSSCVFDTISCLQRFPERERPWLWERPNPNDFLQKYSQKSYTTGLGWVEWGNRMWGVGRWGGVHRSQSVLCIILLIEIKGRPVQTQNKQMKRPQHPNQVSFSHQPRLTVVLTIYDMLYIWWHVTAHFWSHPREKGTKMTDSNSSTSCAINTLCLPPCRVPI